MTKTYGSLRKYKAHLRERGDFHNPSEQAFENAAGALDLDFHRQGYPDYQLIKNGEIVGFVEVKPNKTSQLRPSQKRFRAFCQKQGIPFFQWSPEEVDALLLIKQEIEKR